MEINIILYGILFLALGYGILSLGIYLFSTIVGATIGKSSEEMEEWVDKSMLAQAITFSMLLASGFGSYQILNKGGITTEFKLPELLQAKLDAVTNKQKILRVKIIDGNEQSISNAEVKLLSDIWESPMVKYTNKQGYIDFTDLTNFPQRYKVQKNCLEMAKAFKELDFENHDTIIYTIPLNGFGTSIRFVNTSLDYIKIWKVSSRNGIETKSALLELPPMDMAIGGNYGKAEERKFLGPDNYTFEIEQLTNCDEDAFFFFGRGCETKRLQCRLTKCDNVEIFIKKENSKITYSLKDAKPNT